MKKFSWLLVSFFVIGAGLILIGLLYLMGNWGIGSLLIICGCLFCIPWIIVQIPVFFKYLFNQHQPQAKIDRPIVHQWTDEEDERYERNPQHHNRWSNYW